MEEELEDKRKNAREWKRLSGANMPIGLAKNVQARKSKTKTTRERVATRKISHQLCIVQLQVLISGCIGKVSKWRKLSQNLQSPYWLWHEIVQNWQYIKISWKTVLDHWYLAACSSVNSYKPFTTKTMCHERCLNNAVSWTLPYKKLVLCVRDHSGAYQCISVQVMEVLLNRHSSYLKHSPGGKDLPLHLCIFMTQKYLPDKRPTVAPH